MEKQSPFKRFEKYLDLYIGTDFRNLALFRIFLATVGIFDVLQRLPLVEILYSNQGFYPNHQHLSAPAYPYHFSILSALNHTTEVYVFFFIVLVALFCLLIGYQTRWAHWISAIGILSIESRNPILANGGDIIMNLWWVISLFLPLYATWSVDSALGKLPTHFKKQSTSYRHAAIALILFELAMVYFLNTVHKSGQTWTSGTAMYWVLQQDRLVSPFGNWLFEHFPFWFFQFLTYGALCIEGLAFPLILSPWRTRQCRHIIATLLFVLHLGIFVMIDVGLFSWQIMIPYAFLIHKDLLVWIENKYLDLVRKIANLPMPNESNLDQTNSNQSHQHTHSNSSDPCIGESCALFSDCKSANACVNGHHDFHTYAHHHLLELAEQTNQEGKQIPKGNQTKGLMKFGWGWMHLLQAILLTYLMMVMGSYALSINPFFKSEKWLNYQHEMPTWLKNGVHYLRIYQSWSMFSPNAPTEEGDFVIDALLIDGRHIDPQTGLPPSFDGPDFRQLALQPHLWKVFNGRLHMSRYKSALLPYVSKWLMSDRKHFKLGIDDKIVGFKIYWIKEKSPSIKEFQKSKKSVVTSKELLFQGGKFF